MEGFELAVALAMAVAVEVISSIFLAVAAAALARVMRVLLGVGGSELEEVVCASGSALATSSTFAARRGAAAFLFGGPVQSLSTAVYAVPSGLIFVDLKLLAA